MATLTLALAAGATFEQAARLANYAGGIVVMKRGTATVRAAELRHAISRQAGAGVQARQEQKTNVAARGRRDRRG
jgi:bifunctional ADP-heptose synthase (sugar kinase/adenylyltransferase)